MVARNYDKSRNIQHQNCHDHQENHVADPSRHYVGLHLRLLHSRRQQFYHLALVEGVTVLVLFSFDEVEPAYYKNCSQLRYSQGWFYFVFYIYLSLTVLVENERMYYYMM